MAGVDDCDEAASAHYGSHAHFTHTSNANLHSRADNSAGEAPQDADRHKRDQYGVIECDMDESGMSGQVIVEIVSDAARLIMDEKCGRPSKKVHEEEEEEHGHRFSDFFGMGGSDSDNGNYGNYDEDDEDAEEEEESEEEHPHITWEEVEKLAKEETDWTEEKAIKFTHKIGLGA